MADSRETMKDALSEFVDTLMDREIASVKTNLSNKSNELQDRIEELTKSVAEEFQSITKDSAEQVSQIEDAMREMSDSSTKSFEEIKTSINEQISNLDTTLRGVITDFSSQIFDRMGQQFTELNNAIEALTVRVHHNEDILNSTAGNHDKITMLLNNFATSISTVKPEATGQTTMIPVQKRETEEVTASVEAPVESVKVEPKKENKEAASAKSEIPATIDETTGQYIYKPELEGHDQEFKGFNEEADSSENEIGELDLSELDAKK